MGFDILSLQRGRGTAPRSKADEGRAVLKYIDVDDLVPSEDNFYSMSDIDELAGLIELSGGVKQPALVSPLGGGKYKVIAGHRRRLASLQLAEQGKEQYRKMPCIVDADEREPGADAEADELRAIDEAILLITTNGQRDKTDWDKVQEATRLRALLEQKRRFEKIPGETRKLIAERLGTTPAQVGRYDSIAKHLRPEFKDLLAKGEIGISLAYDLSTLPEDIQHSAVLFQEQNGVAKLKDFLGEWKENIKRQRAAAEIEQDGEQERDPTPPGEITTITADETGPAPTPEQAKEILEREKDSPASGADVLPEKLEDEDGAPKVQWTEPPAMESAGKVVDFPVPPPPPPAQEPDRKQDQPPERMSEKRAAFCLEDLREYCEGMMGADGEKPETWADYADALTVAIDALRK